MWLFLLGLVVGAVLGSPILFILILRRGSLKLKKSYGFTSVSSGSSPLHQVNEGEMLRIIEGLLPGEPYDHLWVSRTGNGYGGVMLGSSKGEMELSVSFNTHSERDGIQSFREAMAL